MKILSSLALVVALLAVPACGPKPVVVTPPAPVLSSTASQVLETALGVLQTAAITFAPTFGIPVADVTAVVNGVASGMAVIEAAKLGYVSAIDVAFAKIQAALSPATAGTLAPYFGAIQETITALYDQGIV